MLTITISKAELKKAFSGGDASFSQDFSNDGELIVDPDIVLLKIILENSKSTNPKEAA